MYLLKKRLTAILLVVALLISVLGVVYAATVNNYEDPNVVLLEAMLHGDRKWVIDTIVYDKRTANPYGSDQSLMATALSQYENKDDPNYRESYKVMIDVLTQFFYERTWDDDLTATLIDKTEEVAELFGAGDTALMDFLDDLKKTAEEEKYEGILQGVFVDEYVSSWGESVNEQEQSLQKLTEISDALDNLSGLTSYWSTLYGVPGDESETIFDYQKNVINPLISSGRDYLSAFSNFGTTEKQASSAAIVSASALAAWNWHASLSTTYSGVKPITNDLLEMVAGEKASNLMNTASETFSFASGAINQFTFLHSLCMQSETFHDTLMRISNQAASDGQSRMSSVLSDYADKMDDALNENKLAYDLIVNKLAESSTVKKNLKVSSALKAGMPKAWQDAYKASDFASMVKVFEIGMFGVDLATGIKSTCIKMAELKYLRNLITEAQRVYDTDVATYLLDMSGENAKRVLNDLLMLQRLRLRGENIAYKMTKNQLNSGIGKLFSGYAFSDWIDQKDTTEAEAWKNFYQASIDSLIGASLDPIPYSSFVVSAGDRLSIYYDQNRKTYVGSLNHGEAVIYEMQYRVMAGIELQGGTLLLQDIAVPFVDATNGGTITMDASTASIGELTQSGKMNLNIMNGDLDFLTCLDLKNATISLNGNCISSPDMTFSNTISISGGTMETPALHLASATISGGNIICSGDMESTGTSTLSGLTLNGKAAQTVSGQLRIGNLTLNNARTKGVETTSQLYVTGSLSDLANIVKNGINLTSTADIAGGYVASDITLDGTSVSSGVTYARSVTTKSGTTLSGGTVKGALTVSSGTLTNRGSDLYLKNGLISTGATIHAAAPIQVYEEAYFSSTRFTGASPVNLRGETVFGGGNTADAGSQLNLYRDCTSSGSSNQLAALNICGNIRQSIGYSGTVDYFTLANSSLAGATMTENIYVQKKLTAANQRISDGKDIILTGSATTALENVSGNLQICDWNGTGFTGLRGTLYAAGNNTITEDMSLRGGLRQTSGTMNLNGASITCREDVEASGRWNIDAGSALIINGDGYLSGTVVNDGAMSAKELTVNGLSGNGTVTVTKDFKNQAANTFGTLVCAGNAGQTVSGSNITVQNLYIDNPTQKGVTFTAQAYVTGDYINHGHVHGLQPIQLVDGTVFSRDATIAAFKPDGDVAIEEGVTVTVNGDVTLKGLLRLGAGAKLIVKGDLIGSSARLAVTEQAIISTKGNLILSSTTATIDGNITVWRDTKLSGGTVQGNGTLTLNGDLENSAAISGLSQLTLSGKVPQSINGSVIHVGTVKASNTSARGVDLTAAIYYSQVCDVAEHCKINLSKITEEDAS